MKVFWLSHHGMYLGGFSVVAAENETQALEVFKAMIAAESRNDKDVYAKILRQSDDIEIKGELDLSMPNAVMIWNGDY